MSNQDLVKLLIVGDEVELLSTLTMQCQRERYVVETAESYKAASLRLASNNYDCILFDVELLRGNRLQLLEDLKRSGGNGGLIAMSSGDSLDDRVESLTLWADDFVVTPLPFYELNARIQAVVRRRKFSTAKITSVRNVRIDPGLHSAFVQDEPLSLTRIEYDLLQHLIANRSRVLTKQAIAEHIWKDRTDDSNSFDFLFVHIKNLKKKLKAAGASLGIKTIYGVGYQVQEI